MSDTNTSDKIRPPMINYGLIPRGERKVAHFVGSLLFDLGELCEEFRMAMLLMEHTRELLQPPTDPEQHNLYLGWRIIGAKDAASTIYKFHENMHFISLNLNKCPHMLSLVDRKAPREARRRFLKSFPGFAGLRHSVHHSGSLYGTPERVAEHSKGEGLNFGRLHGFTLTCLYEKKEISLSVTPNSAVKLIQVRDMYWNGFMPMDYELMHSHPRFS